MRISDWSSDVCSSDLHELGNNSIKYGALGSDGGRVWLRWWSDREQAVPMLRILWEEKSSDAHPAVRRSGFGTELLTKTIPFELDGSGTIDWTHAALDRKSGG